MGLVNKAATEAGSIQRAPHLAGYI